MNNLDTYIEHCSGFYSFLAWIEQQNETGKPYGFVKQITYLDPFVSKYFSIAVPKSKKKELFLAVQAIESEWMSLIKWSYLAIRGNEPYLYIVSPPIKGDQENYPDMPSFAIALYVDTMEKRNLIVKQKKILAREYFLDADKKIRFNFHKNIFNLPIRVMEENENIIIEEDLLEYSEIIAMKENRAKRYEEKPEFIGDVAKIEGTEGLMKKWKENNV